MTRFEKNGNNRSDGSTAKRSIGRFLRDIHAGTILIITLLIILVCYACYVLGVFAYAKMDFIVRDNRKDFVFLESDSLPQLYPDSHLVISAKASGRSFGDLCDKIMEMSLVKKFDKRREGDYGISEDPIKQGGV